MPLRNTDMSDREVLLAMGETQDDDGLILAEDVAEYLGVRGNDKRSPGAVVSSRLAWMRRFGYVDRVDPKTLGLPRNASPRYIITPLGAALMGGRITASVARVLEKEDIGSTVLLMREIAQRAYVRGSFGTAAAVRREWTHNAAQRIG